MPCRRFLHERPEDCLQRLVMMTRGLADPLASSYCRLYMAHCFRRLASYDIGKHSVLYEYMKVISLNLHSEIRERVKVNK